MTQAVPQLFVTEVIANEMPERTQSDMFSFFSYAPVAAEEKTYHICKAAKFKNDWKPNSILWATTLEINVISFNFIKFKGVPFCKKDANLLKSKNTSRGTPLQNRYKPMMITHWNSRGRPLQNDRKSVDVRCSPKGYPLHTGRKYMKIHTNLSEYLLLNVSKSIEMQWSPKMVRIPCKRSLL